MEPELMDDAVTEHDQCLTAEQSSSYSTTSLSEVSDVQESRTGDTFRRSNDKDKRDISSEVLYDLSSPPAECNVLAVSVSQPPNNALHLHLSSSENIHALQPSAASDGFLDNSRSISPNPDGGHALPRPPYRVRFRSRVRIASGAHRHRHPHSYPHTRPPSQRASQSAESVDSESSLCSSISAPLRCAPDESEAHSSYSYTFSALLKNKRRRPRKPPPGIVASLPARLNPRSPEPGERAPLLRAPGSRLGARTRRLYGDPDPDEGQASPRQRPAREDIDAFGRWPWRLLNGYWWAWRFGSAVGCCCPADGDEDDSEDEQHHQQQQQQQRNGGSGR